MAGKVEPGSADIVARLEARILHLERSARRLKSQLENEKENRKDSRAEIHEARNESIILAEEMEKREAQLEQLQRQVDRYRGWWINEYYFVKVLLQIVPNPKDVEHIAAASHRRHMIYQTEGSS